MKKKQKDDDDGVRVKSVVGVQALTLQAEQQEEARLLLQEKDQYRQQVRELTEKCDKLELLLLRSQGEVLQLRTRLRRLTCNTHQVRGSGRWCNDNIGDGVLTKAFSFSVRGAVRKRSRRQRMLLKVSNVKCTSLDSDIVLILHSGSELKLFTCGFHLTLENCWLLALTQILCLLEAVLEQQML